MSDYPNNYKPTLCIEDKILNARFVLGNEGDNTLMCFGINPSTADLNKADRTMSLLIKISSDNQYDSYMMMNPYPLRASHTWELPTDGDSILIKKNFIYIESIFKRNKGQSAIAAWGNIFDKKTYIRESALGIIELSKKYSIQWMHVGNLTSNGHPRSLSYYCRRMKCEDTTLHLLNIDSYIENQTTQQQFAAGT